MYIDVAACTITELNPGKLLKNNTVSFCHPVAVLACYRGMPALQPETCIVVTEPGGGFEGFVIVAG
jgi:hypothetical protein